MYRYQILIEYDGSRFFGWQIQKKGKTIQGIIQKKISKLLKEKIIISAAGIDNFSDKLSAFSFSSIFVL